jgi:putative DNA primase/helicase
MRAREIAMALGGTGRPETRGRYRCCCPVHGDVNPSMTVQDYPARSDGIDVKCWSANCNPLAIKRELARRNLITGTVSKAERIDAKAMAEQAAKHRAEQAKRRELAGWLWSKGEPNAAEVVRYLSEGRAIDLDRIGGVPAALRYQIDAVIPETEPKRYGFAMVAAVTDALGQLAAVHQTFLNFSGNAKAGLGDDKYITGAPSGAAVQLTEAGADLGVSEGIETALSAAELHGVPTWAALNTSGLIGFMVPSRVKRLTIFADRDRINPKTGKRPGTYAAETLAARLIQQRIECRIKYPALDFADFNDELMARKRQRGAA